MSVLNCNRLSCDNIMCDTYVPEIGYICRECQEEFKDYFSNETDLLPQLSIFMQTEKEPKPFSKTKIVDEFFEQYT